MKVHGGKTRNLGTAGHRLPPEAEALLAAGPAPPTGGDSLPGLVSTSKRWRTDVARCVAPVWTGACAVTTLPARSALPCSIDASSSAGRDARRARAWSTSPRRANRRLGSDFIERLCPRPRVDERNEISQNRSTALPGKIVMTYLRPCPPIMPHPSTSAEHIRLGTLREGREPWR